MPAGDPWSDAAMKALALACVLAAPSLASADKNFMSSGSHDCASDPIVNINSSAGAFTLTGACKTVNVNGADNKLTIASVGQLNINGSTNAVDTEELGGANATGSGNKVTYVKAQKGSKPTWRAVGTGHSLTKKTADKPAEKGGKKS